jgi:hypothetical protein
VLLVYGRLALDRALQDGRITADQEATPDERTDVPQDDTKFIDAGQCVR